MSCLCYHGHNYFYTYHLREDDVVVDVGAYIGNFTRDALTLGASKIIAVEPSPPNIQALHTIKDPRLTIIQKAVWYTHTQYPFNLKHSAEVSCLAAPNIPYWLPENIVGNITVECDTLDNICINLTNVDFLKMDIEGSEVAALLGANHVLQRTKHVAIAVYDRDDYAQVTNYTAHNTALTRILETYGFHVRINTEEESPRRVITGDKIKL